MKVIKEYEEFRYCELLIGNLSDIAIVFSIIWVEIRFLRNLRAGWEASTKYWVLRKYKRLQLQS